MGRRTFLMHFVPFPGASPFLTATVLRPPSGQLPPPNTFIRLRMAALSSGSGAVVVRCRERAGSRESMVAGACGGCNGCGRSDHGKAGIHARRACRRHDSLPYRNRAAADGLSEIAPLCEDGRSKKSLCPVWGHRQEKQAGEGEFEGEALSHRQQRCDRMAAAGRARCDAGSYGHRQQRCDRMAAAGRAR